MFKTDLRVFIEIPYESEIAERVPHRGSVTGAGSDEYTASFLELQLDISEDNEIQIVRRIQTGVMRYGVHCIDAPGSTPKAELGRINLEIQREQARRMSGADL